MLDEKFKEVIKHGETGKIYLISTPTALGKTEKLPGTHATIALPTNSLKNEIADRIRCSTSTGSDFKFTTTPDTVEFESKELNLKQNYYYSIGLPAKSMRLLHYIVRNSEEFSDYDVTLAHSYLGYLQETLILRTRLLQLTRESCSRKGLKRYGQKISEMVENKPVIIFKGLRSIFQNPVEGIWFGNCSGYDGLKGQDIVIVGTPHRNPLQYLLTTKVCGIDFNTNDTTMSYQKVEYKGYRFMMKCYDNEELRNIQLSLIESDLVQAVGRARTLRTDATVELYSNFPLSLSERFIY